MHDCEPIHPSRSPSTDERPGRVVFGMMLGATEMFRRVVPAQRSALVRTRQVERQHFVLPANENQIGVMIDAHTVRDRNLVYTLRAAYRYRLQIREPATGGFERRGQA